MDKDMDFEINLQLNYREYSFRFEISAK